jgi:hypothetical protein
MQPATALALVVDPVLVWLEPMGVEWDDRARRFLVAVGFQESGLVHRYQHHGGPARGLWQFERNGVLGVLQHPASEGVARIVCGRHGIKDTVDDVHGRLAEQDSLACAFARLLLWTDTRGLPVTEAQAWAVYLRLWRPGKPRPEHWRDSWSAAVRCVGAAPQMARPHANVNNA